MPLSNLKQNKGELQKDFIERAKQYVRSLELPQLPIKLKNEILYCTLHLLEKTDTGFHIVGIFEPDVASLSGKNGIITEIYYDLRYKKYYVKRNFKEVKFSERNIDGTFKYVKNTELFEFLSTKGNEGMYDDTFKTLRFINRNNFQKGNNLSLSKYFVLLIERFNGLELLHKIGIKNIGLLEDEWDFTKTKPHQMLNVSKQAIKTYVNHYAESVSFDRFYRGIEFSSITQWLITESPTVYKYYKKNKDKWRSAYLDILVYMAKLEEEFGITKTTNFLNQAYGSLGFSLRDYIGIQLDKFRRERNIDEGNIVGIGYKWRELLIDSGLDLKRLLRYLYFEVHVSQGISDGYDARVYLADYLSMANDMGYTNVERYPKSLKLRHDVISMNHKVKIDEINKAKWRELAKEKRDLEFKYKNMHLIYPSEAEDLILEGNALGHCVGSYVSSVLSGNSDILFLRKEDDLEKSFYTVEVRGNRVTQVYGRSNSPATSEVKEFIKKYKEEKEFD